MENFKKWKKTIIELIIKNKRFSVFLLVTFILIILLILNLILPIRYPLDVNVWGTVSDWFIVTFTAYTAYYLIRNFYLQKRLDEIKIMPVFRIENPILNSTQNILSLKALKNNAYLIAPSRVSLGFIDINNIFIHDVILEEDSLEIGPIDFTILQPNSFFRFSFKDAIGNTYFQTIIYTGNRTFRLQIPIKK